MRYRPLRPLAPPWAVALLGLGLPWLSVSGLTALRAEDCNRNGVEDDLDLARKTSRDCDRDGLPDECREEPDLFFVTRERYPVCSDSQAPFLISDDLDGDGDIDVAALSARVLSILRNRGDVPLGRRGGRFRPPEIYELGFHPYGIISDDFDLDGDSDLLVVDHYGLDGAIGVESGTRTSRMSLYANDGSGRFEFAGIVDPGPYAYGGTSGDVDGDGDADVVLPGGDNPHSSTHISVILNRGDGTFEPPVHLYAGITPRFSHLADVDRDGRLDIVTVLWRGGGVSILKNLGDLRFEGPEVYEAGPGPATVDSGDLDGDGDLDLAVGNRDTTILALLYNDGEGGFDDHQYVHRTGARQPGVVQMGDLDRDGDLDLTTSYGPALQVYYNQGERRFGFARFGAGSTMSHTLADFDGDGWLDVAASSIDGEVAHLSFLRNRGGTFVAPRTYPVHPTSWAYEPQNLISADFDGDGDLDLAANNGNGSNGRAAVAILANDGTGDFSDLQVVVVNRAYFGAFSTIRALDSDGDGDLDILAGLVGSDPPGFLVLTNEAGEFRYTRFVSGPAEGLALGDFDGDGRTDLADDGRVFWNEGGLELTEQFVLPLEAGRIGFRCAEQVVTGDWDGDGRLDVAFECVPERLSVCRNLGSRRFELIETREYGRYVFALESGDFNGDGLSDLAVGRPDRYARLESGWPWIGEPNAVEVLLSDGAGGFEVTSILPMGEQRVGAILAVDLDQDQDDDIIVSGGEVSWRQEVALFISRGDGSFGERRVYVTDGQATYVTAGDFDADDHLDLAIANSTGGAQITVLLNQAPGRGPDSGVRGCGEPVFFRRGDIDGNGRVFGSYDGIRLLVYLFLGDAPPPCQKSADVDDNGYLDLSDAVLLLMHFYYAIPPQLPPPYLACGPDPTPDDLSCDEPISCR